MKLLLTFVAATALFASSAFADIRSYHGGFSIGIGSHHGHGHHRHHGHHHSYHHGFGGHRYNHGYLGLGYGSIFHPAYFASNYSSPTYVEERTVVVRERAPKAPRASTYAPTWKPGSWKTHPWYRSRPAVITVPDTLRDARSSAQLQQIYGDQASALAR